MRISAQSGDPGFANYCGPCRVYLDDVEQLAVFAVDAEAGYVELFVRDQVGNFCIENYKIVRETKTGVVRIESIGDAIPEQPDSAASVVASRKLPRFF